MKATRGAYAFHESRNRCGERRSWDMAWMERRRRTDNNDHERERGGMMQEYMGEGKKNGGDVEEGRRMAKADA